MAADHYPLSHVRAQSDGIAASPVEVPVDTPAVELMSADECWALLGTARVGRVAVDIAGQPDIFPVNHGVHDRAILFRTQAGTKLAATLLGRHVAFEIDDVDPDTRTVWSVVVRGLAREVLHPAAMLIAAQVTPPAWTLGAKPHFVQIDPMVVSGRRFRIPDQLEVAAPRRAQPTAV